MNPELPDKPALKELQTYVSAVGKQRGFDKETLAEAFILLAEEVGELARIVRKSNGLKTRREAKKLKADEELADIFIYVLHMSNILGIDLETAFRRKEETNKKRTWA